jgi:hypothetical protein
MQVQLIDACDIRMGSDGCRVHDMRADVHSDAARSRPNPCSIEDYVEAARRG